VTVDLSYVRKLWPTAARVRACVDQHCKRVAVTHDLGVAVGGPSLRSLTAVSVEGPWLRSATVVSVSVDVETRTGVLLYHATRTAKVTKYAPNGVRCGPVCYLGYAIIDPRTRSLTTDRQQVRVLRCEELEAITGRHQLPLPLCLKRLSPP
jgi:hypothetical protein